MLFPVYLFITLVIFIILIIAYVNYTDITLLCAHHRAELDAHIIL